MRMSAFTLLEQAALLQNVPHVCSICLKYFFRGAFSLLLRTQNAACLQKLCQGPSCREVFSDRYLRSLRGIRRRKDDFIVFIEEPALCSRIDNDQKPMSGGQKDVFFDMGGYVYNISFFMRNGETESEIDEILNSITVSAPDAEKLGNLMRAGFEYDDGYYKASDDDMTVTLPYSFEADSLYGSGYMDTLTGVEISANGYAYFEDFDGFGKSATEYVRKADIIKAPAIETIDGKECCTCTTRSGAYYIEFYAVNTEKGYYDFAVRYPELMYSEANRERVRSIITSAEFK